MHNATSFHPSEVLSNVAVKECGAWPKNGDVISQRPEIATASAPAMSRRSAIFDLEMPPHSEIWLSMVMKCSG